MKPEEQEVCPDCGSKYYDGDACEECSVYRLDCPFCGKQVERANDGPSPCGCAIAWFAYGSGEICWGNEDFRKYCIRQVKQKKSADADEEEFGFDKLQKVTGKIPWIEVRVVGEDGAKGHCNPNVWFFAKKDDQKKFKPKAPSLKRQ
jgi:hypothetical protein